MSNTFPFLSATSDGGVLLRVHAQPGASKNQIVGLHGEALKVKVRAVPEDGRANQALCELLAETLGVAGSRVELVSGAGSRAKVFRISGIDLANAQALLGPHL